MAAFTIAAATAAIVSAGSSIFGGISANKSAKEAAKKEAIFEQKVTMSKLEDLKKDEEAMKGQTLAGAAGAGVKVDKGSPLQVLAEQAREFQRERHTIAQVGATRAAAATTRGRMAGQQAMYQGAQQGASSLANAFAMFGKVGKGK